MTDFSRRPPPGPGPSSLDAEQDLNRNITPLETPAAAASPVLATPPRPRSPIANGVPLGGQQPPEPTRSRAAQSAPLPSVIFDPMPRPRVPPAQSAGVAPPGAPPPFSEEMLDVQTERRTAPPGPPPPPADAGDRRGGASYASSQEPERRAGPGPERRGPPEAERRGPSVPPGGPDRRSAAAAPSQGYAGPERRGVRRTEGSDAPAAHRFWPAQPKTLQEAGLNATFVEELVLKAIFFAGEMRGMDVATRLQLPSALVDEIIEGLRRQKYIDIRGGGGSGVGRSTMIYQLTTFVTDVLRQILDRNRYNGPAPVPFNEWAAAVKLQTVRGNRITRHRMQDKFGDLIIRDYIFDGIGPAMNSGRAIFFYGPPGNGKTAICQGMVNCYEGDIFVPHALLIDDFVVKMFDANIHRAVEDEPGAPSYDRRWVRCRRPLVVVGGELTLEMLDLVYTPEVKYYEAPFQMKASNGMLLIDDFGRQKVSPKELLNRWIVPLESDVDILTLHTGKKIQVPFDVFAAFSTNLDPSDLVDDAFLRRVRYKLEVRRPDEEQFHEIFQVMCKKRGVPYDARAVDYLIDEHYRPNHRPFAACQPRDLLDQVIDMANYQGQPPRLDPALLDAAVRSYFVRFDKPAGSAPTSASAG
ncbi:ATPase [Corallococcus carmarthensis]|uniref:ATPase n=1 Tax=Corallococcus carmarthensis TaxID=2316728 RepID=UPI00148DA514|nr:ATPase [Corallococcus carmarthensis]NOK20812.1 ATPase [Corallococcus carmarthensis]